MKTYTTNDIMNDYELFFDKLSEESEDPYNTKEWKQEVSKKWVRVDGIYNELIVIIRATDDERPQEIEARIRKLAKELYELSQLNIEGDKYGKE